MQGNFKIELFRAYFRKRGFYIDIDNPIEYIKHLRLIANRVQQNSLDYPPLKGLFESINHAQQFIHFTTFGINQQILGALYHFAKWLPQIEPEECSPSQLKN